VGWATGISKARTAFVKCRRGSEQVCEEGEESKVLEMPCADCELGNRHQKSAHSTHKTYVHGGGSERGLNEPARRGRCPRSSKADGRRVRAVSRAIGISKMYTVFVRCTYMEGGRRGIWVSLRGGEESKVLETRWTACVGCGLGNRYQQSTHSICKMYVYGGGSKWGSNEPARRGRCPRS
jgi:hypothetical protein